MKICLVGNQNSGKTTLFNALTGMNQKIGNWPGVTIEKKSGIIKGTNYEIVDLPGIYSLNPYTEEEKISVNYLLRENPDIIINIVDATCLERSLYLTTQLLELPTNVIVALNMVDMLEKKRISIDVSVLEKELDVKVCKISALKQTGIDNLIESIEKDNSKLKKTNNNLSKENICIKNNNKNLCRTRYCRARYNKNMQKNKYNTYEEIATERYNYISKIVEECVYRKNRWTNTTEMLDKVFLNKIFAIPIFILIMFGVYYLSVGVVGKYMSDIMTVLMQELAKMTKNFLVNAPEWIQSLVIDGAIKGVASVVSFIPQLVILFTCISILETTGYMSRIAFLLDNIFKKVGLSRKVNNSFYYRVWM